MATVANSAGEKTCSTKKEKNHLTPTGLLMEGDCTQNPSRLRSMSDMAMVKPIDGTASPAKGLPIAE